MNGRFAVRGWRAVSLGVGAVLLVGLAIAWLGGGGHGHHPGVRRPVAAPGSPALPPPATPLLGVSVNHLFLDGTYSPAQIDAQLSALEQTGATDARCDALWDATEPQPPTGGTHRYDWSFDDRIAGALARHRLRWLPIIDYSVSWAQSIPGQDHSAPKFPLAYAAYAAAFVARYGSGGSFWRQHPALPALPVGTIEIWNEPDGHTFWLPAADPVGYGRLYADARAAVKATASNVRVIVGGLTNLPVFLPELLSARPDLRGHIDGVAIHLYLPSPQAIVTQVSEDRVFLRSLGMATVPLYLTEFGWTPRPRGTLGWAPARLRPHYISTTISGLAQRNCALAGIFLYSWVTPERNPANGFDWFGIHHPDGGHTASEYAFAAGIRAAKAARASPKPC
ncbi:MAG: polysaccharide biosynthesis protein PslG [Solirubrobacteraceae bacterium]|jgi:hypothetical protein|nr:polysaccharide biosynthesis protein PslG [Solirubrobacteraceae bacterium]